MESELVQKLTSRKFWLATAAFLGSIATTVSGITTDNEAVAVAGIACGAASAAIYAACEAYTDGARAKANATTTEILETKALSETKAVNVSSTGSTAAAVAEKVLVPTSADVEPAGGAE